MKIHEDFFSVFKKREFAALQGDSKRNLFVLILIFWGTSTAIGFSNGSLEYLRKKMASPFVNWVDLLVSYDKQDRIDDIMRDLQNDSINDQYNILKVTGYHRFPMNFWNPEAEGTFSTIGRTIDLQDNVLDAIIAEDNLIDGRTFRDELDFGFIVTRSFLADMGYDENSSFIYWSERLPDDTPMRIPLPVIAVVKDLPGMHRFAVTPNTYSLFVYRSEARTEHPFMHVNESSLFLFLEGDTEEAGVLADKLETALNDTGDYSYVMAIVSSSNDTYKDGQLIQLSFSPRVSGYKAIGEIYNGILEYPFMQEYRNRVVRYHKYDPHMVRTATYDNISVSFSSLSDIRDFSQWLTTLEHGLEMDIAQVEAKENYDFISSLTQIISFVLIIFSVYAAGLFLRSVLRMHLEKIKMNLGTFLAFGLQYETIRQIYLSISYRFVVTALLVALTSSFVIGNIGGIRLVFWLFSTGLEQGETYFRQFNYLTIVSVVMILAYTYYIVNHALKNQLTKTPGDLIYERG